MQCICGRGYEGVARDVFARDGRAVRGRHALHATWCTGVEAQRFVDAAFEHGSFGGQFVVG